MCTNSVARFNHRGLGAMLRLTIVAGLIFDLTLQEARILARALKAVRESKSNVDEVYMSPIASDVDFSAKVMPDGLLLQAQNPPLRLGWPEVDVIAASLADLAGADLAGADLQDQSQPE